MPTKRPRRIVSDKQDNMIGPLRLNAGGELPELLDLSLVRRPRWPDPNPGISHPATPIEVFVPHLEDLLGALTRNDIVFRARALSHSRIAPVLETTRAACSGVAGSGTSTPR